MRCRVGDLAVIHAPDCYAGRFVQCVEAYGYCLSSVDRGPHWWVVPQSGWAPDHCSLRHDGAFVYPDSMLRPIRPNDGEDETLSWTTKPSEIETLYEALEALRNEP